MNEDFEFGESLPVRDGEVSSERWVRVREQIVFMDLAKELLSKSGMWKQNGNAISCPFHGSDRTPSFTFYPSSNSAFCFGCPPPKQNQTYDAINFVAKFFGINKYKALQWIEKHYQLPFIGGSKYEEDDEEEEEETLLSVRDLQGPFLLLAPKLIETVDDAKDLLKTYFIALKEDDPLFLARVIGRERLASIKVKGVTGVTGSGSPR